MAGKKMRAPALCPESIALMDDDVLRDRLGVLSLGEQTALFLRSDWLDRVKIVRNSELAAEVVASVPDEEILLTFKGAGEEAGLPLIGLATDDQLRFILDVDLWTQHAIDEERVVKWLGYLVSCGEDVIAGVARACDMELVVVFLSKLIRLIPFDEAVELGEEMTSIMPDEAFVVQSRVPEEIPSVRLLLTALRNEDRDLYSDLRYSTYRAIEAEIEDDAYRWRNSRLEEKGILEYVEASRIYERMPESEIKGLAGFGGRPYYRRPGYMQVPAFYPLRLSATRPLYYELLEATGDEELKRRITGDISYITNRLLVAGGQGIGDVSATGDTLGLLFSYANIGLLRLAEGAGREPLEVLEAVSAADLFRIGFGLVNDLHKRAVELVEAAKSLHGREDTDFFEEYHGDVLRGLSDKRPRHYVPGESGCDEYRHFMTPEEVATADRVMAQMAVAAEACFDKLAIAPSSGSDAAKLKSAALGIDCVHVGNLLTTVYAHFATGGNPGIAPLTDRELDAFLETAFAEGKSRSRSIDAAVADKFISWLKHKTGFRGHKWAILEAYFMERLELLEEELSQISSAADTDPLLVESVLLAKRH